MRLLVGVWRSLASTSLLGLAFMFPAPPRPWERDWGRIVGELEADILRVCIPERQWMEAVLGFLSRSAVFEGFGCTFL